MASLPIAVMSCFLGNKIMLCGCWVAKDFQLIPCIQRDKEFSD
jgi:hypothetical protein